MAVPKPIKAALVQTRSGRDITRNMAMLDDLVRRAHGRGARYALTPENSNIMETDRERLFAVVRPEAEAPEVRHCRDLAKELGLWLHVGSMAIRVASDRLANRALLIAPDGTIAARYDKIHMFDVDLAGGESYRESRSFQAGSEAVTADLPWGRLGLTICYDLRFPALFRTLAQAGADVIAVPSAFTRQTGEAHWHVLLRTRAIETGCYVLAAAQGGTHETGRVTFGHSLAVAPWGEIIAEGGTEPSVIDVAIDLGSVKDSRRKVPALHHDRDFSTPPADQRPAIGRAS